MKLFISGVILFLVSLISASEFSIVRDIQEIPGDLTAQKYGQKDVFGQWCAIVKIYSDIKDLQFSGQGYEKHDYRDNIYFVYMQPESGDIYFTKSGYEKNSDGPIFLRREK